VLEEMPPKELQPKPQPAEVPKLRPKLQLAEDSTHRWIQVKPLSLRSFDNSTTTLHLEPSEHAL
jgi:hypothetical protein